MSRFICFSIVALMGSVANAQLVFVPPPTCHAASDYAYRGCINERSLALINALDRHGFKAPAFVGPTVVAAPVPAPAAALTSGAIDVYSPPACSPDARYFVKRDVILAVYGPTTAPTLTERAVPPDGGRIVITPMKKP